LFWMFTATKQTVTSEKQAPGEAQPGLSGKAATIYINAYDKEDYSLGEVYPNYYVVDSAGNFIVDGVNANSANSVVGEVLSFYGKDDGTYYVDPKLNWKVPNEAPTVNLDAHTSMAEAGGVVTGYDRTGSATLTADDDADNTNDYSMTLGANQEETFFLELQNTDSESLYQVGAICVFWNNDIAEVTVESDGWTKVDMPKSIRDASISIANDAGTAFTMDYDQCYVPSKPIQLHEWDRLKVEFKVKAGTNNPSANAGDSFGAIFLDSGYYKGSDGKVYLDFYTHDNEESTSAVGIDETEASPQGLQIGAAIEGL